MEEAVPFRIGIVGGMGPAASVEFQRLIVAATHANRDQEHLEIVCFTAPKIPDRTVSLAEDDGVKMAVAIRDICRRLLEMGVSVIAIPCLTAHARILTISHDLPVPIINLVDLAITDLRERFPKTQTVGILATDGALRERIFEQSPLAHGLNFLTPKNEEQGMLMHVISALKAGSIDPSLTRALRNLKGSLFTRGAEALILGCTELTFFRNELGAGRLPAIDPLEVASRHLVSMAKSWTL